MKPYQVRSKQLRRKKLRPDAAPIGCWALVTVVSGISTVYFFLASLTQDSLRVAFLVSLFITVLSASMADVRSRVKRIEQYIEREEEGEDEEE